MSAKPKILLTGATGFIGKAILLELIREDYPVMVLARAPERVITTSPHMQVCACSLENITNDVAAAIRAFAPEVVIHAAWMGTENTNRNNAEFVLPNLQSTLRLFELTVVSGCRRWIAFGSQAEYSEGIETDISEESPTFPKTAYGVTKLATCHTLQALAISHGMECVWLRIFASYGSEYTASYVMPYLLECFRKNEIPVFKTPHAVWDYIHVSDVAKAALAAAQLPQAHGVFNLATGVGSSVADIALMLAKTCGFTDMKGLHHAIDQCQDVPTRRVADIDKIIHDLRWKPEIDLTQELARANVWT